MKWNRRKQKLISYKAQRVGDKRTVTKFLWKWMRIDEQWRWLEKATWEEVCFSINAGFLLCGNRLPDHQVTWIPQKWVDKKKYTPTGITTSKEHLDSLK